jgi:hypothetical protein
MTISFDQVALAAHEILCIALFYGAFCRAVWANKQTKQGMLLIIRLTGAVATIGMVAPIAWHYRPDWFAMLLMTLSVCAQYLASHNWRDGIPHIFQKEH